MRVLRLAPLLAAVLATGCAKEFTPRSVLFDLRVLAIVPAPPSQPLELGPSDSLTLQAIRVPPPGATIATEAWTFCPFSIGATAGYACAVHGPACEVPLDPSGSPTEYGSAPVTATPGALAVACLESLAGSGALPPNVPPQVPERLEVLFRYVVTASDGSSREAVQRVPVYPAGAPADPNVAPAIDEVRIGGTAFGADGTQKDPTAPRPTLTAGGALDVVARVSGEQTYVEGGRTLTETLVVSFYTTAGRFDFDRANGPDASVKLKGEELGGATSAQVWAVVRDLRGGEAVAGPFAFDVSPDPPSRPFP